MKQILVLCAMIALGVALYLLVGNLGTPAGTLVDQATDSINNLTTSGGII